MQKNIFERDKIKSIIIWKSIYLQLNSYSQTFILKKVVIKWGPFLWKNNNDQ